MDYRIPYWRVRFVTSNRWVTSHDPQGCKTLRGYRDQWRIRIGDWRVVYLIDDTLKLVSIVRIAHRRDVYE